MSFIEWFNNNNNHQLNNDQIISNFSEIWGLISTVSDEPVFENNETIFLNESSPKLFFDNTNNTLNGQGLGAITVSKDTNDNTVYTLNKDVTIINILDVMASVQLPPFILD